MKISFERVALAERRVLRLTGTAGLSPRWPKQRSSCAAKPQACE